MIGTRLIEELVQSVALTHRIKNHDRVSLLLIAAPESGKTTIVSSAHAKHVCRVALLTGRSVLRELKDHPATEFLFFNDLTSIRAMSTHAVNLLIVLLNQLTQDERGIVGFAGKEVETIQRAVGIIACITFSTFTDHRARWKELGFVSRMIPFAYSYPAELVAEIKDTIDAGTHAANKRPQKAMPKPGKQMIAIACAERHTRRIRHLADARAHDLKQLGIRLLRNYHSVTRAHALLSGRLSVNDDDIKFLRAVDAFVSITHCQPLATETNAAPKRRAS